eukprot:15327072-Ditylum_brightwellii.AAC.1
MKIWHTIWKGYNPHYEVRYIDRVLQESKAAFAWQHKFWNISQGNENQEYPAIQVMGMTSIMEPEEAGSRLDITIETELTALKRMAEGFTILQYPTKSMRIMTYQHVGKHAVCRLDETRKIGSEDNFAGPFMKNLASP